MEAILKKVSLKKVTNLMAEELDFEAEIPANDNLKKYNEVETTIFDTTMKELSTVKMEGDARELQSDTGELESDTGEILSDTGEIDDKDLSVLEDGEIEDNTPIPKRNSETTCRFFQRGTCLYGSQCRNLHVSDMVYNMFDPVLCNRSNCKSFELQNFPMPPAFHPPPMPMMAPDIESPWERGIKKAKIVIQNANYRKKYDDLDIENDWERCLEEAKATIQKAVIKPKNPNVEKPYTCSKYPEREKLREKGPIKRDLESNFYESHHQTSHSKYKKDSYCEKKTRPDIKQAPDHFRWVDPWRRSKSPKKRSRLMSFSLSPSPPPTRSRKRTASSSSSSSCFKSIYGSQRKAKPSTKRSRSSSRSVSASPRSRKGFKARTYSQKRSYSKSVSRSFSKSPRKRCCSGSYSSSSASSEKVYEQKKTTLKTLPTNKLWTKDGNRHTPMEQLKDIPRPSKPSFKDKSSSRASSPCNSDDSSSSDLSKSSLSYTSISSLSDVHTSRTTCSETREGKTLPKSKRDQVSQERARETSKPSQRYQKSSRSFSNTFNKVSKMPDDGLNHNKRPSPNRRNIPTPSDASTKSKSYSAKTSTRPPALSNKSVGQAPKPPVVKVANEKPSAAAMELLRYHSFGKPIRDNTNVSKSQVSKPTQDKTTSCTPEPAKSKTTDSKVPNLQPKSSEVVPVKIAANIHSKPPPMKPANSVLTLNVKKSSSSKRETLLLKLQAIEDAIARKKQ